MSKPASAHTAPAPQQQQQQHAKAVHFEHSSSSVFAAGVPASLATAADGAATPPLGSQGQGSLDAWLAAAGSSGSPAPGSPHCSAGLGSAGSSALQQQQQHVVPLEQHPNLATAGGPGSAPLGVLQVTLQVRAGWRGAAGLHRLPRWGLTGGQGVGGWGGGAANSQSPQAGGPHRLFSATKPCVNGSAIKSFHSHFTLCASVLAICSQVCPACPPAGAQPAQPQQQQLAIAADALRAALAAAAAAGAAADLLQQQRRSTQQLRQQRLQQQRRRAGQQGAPRAGEGLQGWRRLDTAVLSWLR